MENDAATVYCTNESCQAANPLTHKFCLRCSTPLIKNYLWAVVDGPSVGSPGEILADRYLVLDKFLLLDTKPGLLALTSELDNLQPLKAYLRLIPYRLHVPQVYGVLFLGDRPSHQEILLLEKPPLLVDDKIQQVQLASELTTAWRDATSMRQLNWLWQIAHLWQPLASEGVVSSLLDSNVLRVEGSLVRLLELRFDGATFPELPQLGQFWQQLVSGAKPAITEFVNEVSLSLIQGKINSTDQLIGVLDRGLAGLGRSQTPSIKILTKTDTGPSRQRNEDACSPPSGTLVSKPPQPTALAIVCDGIGGHEGGNVASNLAIETIQQQVQQLTKVPYDHIDPSLLLNDLEKAVAIANDKISQRNDSENRQGRQRMGTTLVMALPVAHEMYITHVGDSRAYWITRHGCYQVTLDDDVASREVRLGYAIYREAIQQSSAGSLVQALGMGSSTSLHPTSARFMLDEDAVFLLTSDGLSDFDRVEEYWETEILPILVGEANIANVADRLVEIANTKNGHDNVTIALVHYQVQYWEPEITIQAFIPESSSAKTIDFSSRATDPTLLSSPNHKTQVIPDTEPAKRRSLPLQWIVPLIFVVAAGTLGLFVKQLRSPLVPLISSTPIPTLNPTIEATPIQRSLANLSPGWVIKTNNQITLGNNQSLPPGAFLQVINTKPNPKPVSGNFSVSMRVCANKSTQTPANTNNPAVTSSVPSNSKPLPATVLLDFSQLKRFDVSVLAEDAPSPCTSVTQPPVTQPPDDSSPT
ncbi:MULTISPECIES: PP2C family protein-serine/threonine phosphatase [unclassified Nostoc]|uniref:PP2C family protein-serine/threonine phosphatase n=1 Tax=unclassified Nostoc TaxID=2593658 RepID=UPI002AD4B35C|nr:MULTISPECIES: protein phosphatase 2C domain-containing protein [unclassified Nostoc]MDZ8125853.1 protein phosphatase 2C domain-containing protein [Nostoc sp. CmiVER01]MDZ8225874.1 protein phosphatase 2C domain-containing protein [Nostoc sp. ChiVER01]